MAAREFWNSVFYQSTSISVVTFYLKKRANYDIQPRIGVNTVLQARYVQWRSEAKCCPAPTINTDSVPMRSFGTNHFQSFSYPHYIIGIKWDIWFCVSCTLFRRLLFAVILALIVVKNLGPQFLLLHNDHRTTNQLRISFSTWKNPTEALRLMQDLYGDDTMLRAGTVEWHRRFRRDWRM